MKMLFKGKAHCRACGTTLVPFLSLGKMPLVNSFLKKEEIPSEKKFNLEVGVCPTCHLVQLLESIPPETIYSHYLYLSSASKPFLEHCKKTAEYLTKRLKLNTKSLVVEVASNDGALLQYFKKAGVPILGVDPAQNIAAIANKKGIPTIADFFSTALAKKLKSEGKTADLVYGSNVLAHVPSIVDFVQGVATILKPKGTAIFEFPYLAGLFENKFDTIYHEHVFYYSVLALDYLFKKAGLQLYDIEMVPMQGGSLRIFAAHKGSFTVKDSVRNLLKQEKEAGWNTTSAYMTMSEQILSLKHTLTTLLQDIKKSGKIVAAYSAPAKGNVLLNYFGIDRSHIDYIVDVMETKQGLYTPGTHFLVESEQKITDVPPDYLLILCWNLSGHVISKFKEYSRKGGKFIIPVPEIKIL